MNVTNLLLVPVVVLAACDLSGSGHRQNLSGEQTGCSTECTAPCCDWEGGCENVDPYRDGCASGFAGQAPPPGVQIAASGPIEDFDGNQVGAVELRYSCSCQAWWTETVRYPTSAFWYPNNYEIAASFSGQNTADRCAEPAGGFDAYIDDGLTTYACHTGPGENVVYNNTTTQFQPGACGWIRLKEWESDPDNVDVHRFENCGLCQGCSCNRPPDCSEAALSHDVIFAEDHAEVTVCLGGLEDPDNNLADAEGLIDIAFALASSQPENSTGDGNTAPDVFIEADPANPACVIVRAERKGDQRAARVYSVEFTVTDTCGASCTGARSVRIPHDRRPPQPY